MKKTKKFIVIVLLFLFTGCSMENVSTFDNYADFFNEAGISNINIDIDEQSLEAILKSPMDEEYYSANININDEIVQNVGFRTKGNSSLSSVANSGLTRYSYRIDVDKYEEEQTTKDGISGFVLNNMFADPSYMREYISYKVLDKLGAEVPECGYIRVSINDEYQGLYLMVEVVEDNFLENHFGDSTGNLYKAGEQASLGQGSEENLELKSGEDQDKKGLINMISIVGNENSTNEQIEEVLDLNSTLLYIAYNSVYANYDSLNGQMSHNYYLYELDGKFYFIPWDLNMSFNGFPGAKSDVLVTEVTLESPVYGTTLDQEPFISSILSREKYYNIYVKYIQKLVDELSKINIYIDQINTLIGEEVKNDPTNFFTYDDYINAISYSEDYEFEKNQGEDISNLDIKKQTIKDEQLPVAPKDGEVPQITDKGVNIAKQGGMQATTPLPNYAKARVQYLQQALTSDE